VQTSAELSLRRANRLAALARGLGAEIVPDDDPSDDELVIAGRVYRNFTIRIADNLTALRLLNLFAGDDAANGIEVRALAASFLEEAKMSAAAAMLPDWRPWYARAVHAFVRDRIAFVDDPEQTFRSSDVTLNLSMGNCVNTARLIVALCRAVGIDAVAVPVPDHAGVITHTAARVKVGGAWWWAEGTIAAHFGEEPHAAARRLGIERPDVSDAPIGALGAPCCAACARS
jgi:hypothetical protein